MLSRYNLAEVGPTDSRHRYLDDDDVLFVALIADEENPELMNCIKLDLSSLPDEEIEQNFRFQFSKLICNSTELDSHTYIGPTGIYNTRPENATQRDTQRDTHKEYSFGL